MLTFSIRGAVADIDSTAEDEPLHPSTVLLVEAGDTITRVVVPDGLLQGIAERLGVGTEVQVSGVVSNFHSRAVHVASELRLLDTLH